MTRIRAAGADELAALRDIERAAGELFRAIEMPEVAEDEPPPVAELAGYQRAGRAWVAVDEAVDDRVALGYLVAAPVDGNLHVEQVSVHPASAGRGLGRALIEHLAGLAIAQGVPALTLTTFAEVPWNAPYYRRLGFTEVDESDLGPGLRAIRAREAEAGLDRWPRVAMIRVLAGGPGTLVDDR